MINRILAATAPGTSEAIKPLPTPAHPNAKPQATFDLSTLIDEADQAPPVPQPKVNSKATSATNTLWNSKTDSLQQDASSTKSAKTPNQTIDDPINTLIARVRVPPAPQKTAPPQAPPREPITTPVREVATRPDDQVLPFVFSLPVFRSPDSISSSVPSATKPTAPEESLTIDKTDPPPTPMQPVDLAFSARIHPHNGPDPEAPPPPATGATVESAPAVTLSAPIHQTSFGDSSIAAITSVRDAPTSNFTLPVPVPVPRIEHSLPVSEVFTFQDPPPVATQPLREIVLQLPGSHAVEVRVTEKAGELKVDVRSGDEGLTHELRGSLHDLVSGLDRKGFSAEVSQAESDGTVTSARSGDASASPDSQQSEDGGRAYDQQQQQQQRQQEEEQRDGRSSRTRAAEWVAAFDSNLEARPQ